MVNPAFLAGGSTTLAVLAGSLAIFDWVLGNYTFAAVETAIAVLNGFLAIYNARRVEA